MAWEIALVLGLIGMAGIFTVLAIYFYGKLEWMSILFFMLLMFMMATIVQFNTHLIDINEQSNMTVVGQTVNTTAWNNLRVVNQTWYSPMIYLTLIFGILFVGLLLVRIFKFLMSSRKNEIKDIEDMEFDGKQ